jgi:hypothetical protein
MLILLSLALYGMLGLPFIGWLARRLARARQDHPVVDPAVA